MNTKYKAGHVDRRSDLSNQIRGRKFNGFDAFKFSSKQYFGQRCSVCKTDDLKYSVENSTGIYCRRCEQRAEFVNRERPHIVAAVRREVVKI